MNKERWEYIKQLTPPPPRLVWDSGRMGTYTRPLSVRCQEIPKTERQRKRAMRASREYFIKAKQGLTNATERA